MFFELIPQPGDDLAFFGIIAADRRRREPADAFRRLEKHANILVLPQKPQDAPVKIDAIIVIARNIVHVDKTCIEKRNNLRGGTVGSAEMLFEEFLRRIVRCFVHDQFRIGSPVESYRAAYQSNSEDGGKRHLAQWKRRGVPHWYN